VLFKNRRNRRRIQQRCDSSAPAQRRPFSPADYAVELLESRLLLSSDSGLIFVANQTSNTIGEYTTAGTTVNAALISGFSELGGITVSGSDLFAVDVNRGTVGEYTTTGATVNAKLISGLSFPEDVAVSGTGLFVTTGADTISEYTTSGFLVNASLVSDLNGPEGIVVSGSDLFVTNFNSGTIGEYTTSGGTVNASLVQGLGNPTAIALSGSDLFVTDSFFGEVGEYDATSGATVSASLFGGLVEPEGIAAIGSDLFVADNFKNTIGDYSTSDEVVNAILISGLSGPVSVSVEAAPTIASPTYLGFVQQPLTAIAGVSISPIEVSVLDASGNVVTTDDAPVFLTIFTGPAGASIGGTLLAKAVNGVATFSNITLSDPGTYTLAANSAGLTGVVSRAFNAAVGYVDTADMNVISGWAFDPNDPTASVNVEVVISGGPTQTFAANETRVDLQAVLGSSDHAFTYSTPVLSVGDHTASIYAVETNNTKVLLGTETLVSQNSLFDEHYYLAKYPNVAAAVAAGEIVSGYDHYIKYGQYEGYSPSPYWDEAWYLQKNPDVAAAVQAGKVSSGFMQYYLYGQYENRPGLLYFNTSYYLSNYGNVAAAVKAGTITSAFEHFVLYGQYEGYSPMLYFSSSVYDGDNQDILPFVTGEIYSSDFEQFVEAGQYEGRIASNFYNEQVYLADNSDVAAAVLAGEFPDGFQHWLEYGQYEGRTAV